MVCMGPGKLANNLCVYGNIFLHSNADTKNNLNAWIPRNALVSHKIILETTNYQYIRNIRIDLETSVPKGDLLLQVG